MNVDRIVFWIRMIAWAILDVVTGGDRLNPWFKPERIQFWAAIARAALTAVEGVVPGTPDRPAERSGAQNRSSALWPWFKPERIQFWLQLIARFVVAVIDELNEGASEETGKSGETSGAPAPADTPASEEADN